MEQSGPDQLWKLVEELNAAIERQGKKVEKQHAEYKAAIDDKAPSKLIDLQQLLLDTELESRKNLEKQLADVRTQIASSAGSDIHSSAFVNAVEALGATMGKAVEGMNATIKQEGSALRMEFEKLALKATRMTRSMSSVSETTAHEVVNSLGLQWINGSKLFPIEAPAGGFESIADFAMHEYPTEPKASPPFAGYLQDCLAGKGVEMGVAGGFEVIDTHRNKQMLSIVINGVTYKGYMDAVVVPYGSGSYDQDMRVGVELKQNANDKARYEKEYAPSRKRPRGEAAKPEGGETNVELEDEDRAEEATSSSIVPGNFPFSGWPKGQSTMELLAAYSIARQPVDVVLTDAHIYHILRLRSKRIIYWPNLSTAVALAHLASYLHQADRSLDANSAAVPEDAAAALQDMHAHQPCALAEQAETLMEVTSPQHQLKVALQLMQTWAASGALEEPLEAAMPAEIAAWYGH